MHGKKLGIMEFHPEVQLATWVPLGVDPTYEITAVISYGWDDSKFSRNKISSVFCVTDFDSCQLSIYSSPHV